MKRPTSSGIFPISAAGLALALATSGVAANNLGENTVWGFPATVDKTNKTTTLDQVEKKKAGYYDALRPVYNYTTYIERQFNCSVSALTTANTGSNANSASNSLSMSALTGASNQASAAVGNSQSNSANLMASVSNTLIGVGTGSASGVVSVSGNSIGIKR